MEGRRLPRRSWLLALIPLAFGMAAVADRDEQSPLPPNAVADRIVVDKTRHIMTLYSHEQPLRSCAGPRRPRYQDAGRRQPYARGPIQHRRAQSAKRVPPIPAHQLSGSWRCGGSRGTWGKSRRRYHDSWHQKWPRLARYIPATGRLDRRLHRRHRSGNGRNLAGGARRYSDRDQAINSSASRARPSAGEQGQFR